ncbi:MATE family efflux transporter [Nonlabens spongiae]|uniref:Multidrug-efflux transporter n=1 Tax=Nonlabens spongiae TaxID=331648 RepID=A0A1W6MK17_9FLAO|nr:MATE family efflux transporter [Nonlabens spongiae]ARN77912.1 MATE family efflux transporter [Nonlabens spongiae]
MRLSDYTRELPTNVKLAYPIVLGQIAHLIVALADNIMVGKLGAAQLAAVSLGNTLVFVAMSIGIGFSFAITPLVAETHSNGTLDKTRSYLDNGFLLCVVLGMILSGLLFLAEPILHHMDQPPEVVKLAIPYMRWVALSLIPLMLFQGLKQFSDGLSITTIPMYAAIGANAVNVLLNYFLIYGKWGFPRLEVEGAAIGTLASRVLMFLFIYLTLSRKRELKKFFDKSIKFSKRSVLKLLNIGFPTAMQMFFEVSLFTAAIILSGKLGTEYQAANQIALNLSAITFMFGVGLSVVATIRVSNQVGLKNYIDLKRIARSIFLMTLVLEILFATLFVLLNDLLPLLYIKEVSVIQLAASALLIAALFQISDGFQVVILGALRGLQDVWVPSMICMVSYGLLGLPVSYYLGLKTDLALSGIWIGLCAGLTASSVMMYLRYRYLLSNKLN